MTAQPQNYSVTFWSVAPTNSAERLAGIPPNWPMIVSFLGTNTSVVPPAVLMTKAQLAECRATNQLAYDAYATSIGQAERTKAAANLDRIVALFGQIPTARSQMQTISTNASMTQAQAIAAVRQIANVTDGILEELQRLGPVLRQMYKPEEDQTP